MRRRGFLVLMEQLLMVLVFALAAALCLQAFVLADRISEGNAVRDRALEEAQSAAEVIKSCRGDGAKAADLFGGTWDPAPAGTSTGGSWRIFYDDQWAQTGGEAAYTAVATVSDQGPYLGGAAIQISNADGKAVAELSVSWQTEVDGNAG